MSDDLSNEDLKEALRGQGVHSVYWFGRVALRALERIEELEAELAAIHPVLSDAPDATPSLSGG